MADTPDMSSLAPGAMSYEDRIGARLDRQEGVDAPRSYEDRIGARIDRQAEEEGRLRASVSLASETTPEQLAQQKYLSGVTGVPLEVVKSQEGRVKALAKYKELMDYSASSPVLRAKLQHPEFAGLAQNDGGPLAALENMGKTYFGAKAKSGVFTTLGVGAHLLNEAGSLLGFSTTDRDAAALFKDKPNLLSEFMNESAAGSIGRFSRAMFDASRLANENMSDSAKREYGGLEYATTDWSKSAFSSPTKLTGDIIEQLPQMIALLLASRYGMKVGATEGVAAGAKAMGSASAVSEGLIGYAQQYGSTYNETLNSADFSKSPLYKQAIEAGYAPEAAKIFASATNAQQAGAVAGVVDAIVNRIGGEYLGKIIGEGGKLAPRVGKGFATESITEGVQSVGEQLGQNLATQANIDPSLDVSKGLGESLVQGMTLGGIIGGTLSGVAGRHNEIEDATRSAKELQDVLQTALGVGMREHSPATFAEFAAQTLQQTVQIDGRTLQDLLNTEQGQQLMQKMPEIAQQLPDAVASGGAVELSVAQLATHLPGTALEQAMLENVRVGNNELSLAEAKQRQDAAQEFLTQEAQRVIDQAADSVRTAASAETVRQTIKAQLDAVGRFSSDVNDKGAKLVSEFYTVMAGRMGMTPEQVYNDLLQYKVQAQGQGALTQKQGADLWHGSADPTWIDRGEAFDQTRTANAPSKYQFLSPRREVAETYAGISEMQRWKAENGMGSAPAPTAGVRRFSLDKTAKVLKVTDVKKAAAKLGVEWAGANPLETLLDAAKAQGYDAVQMAMDGGNYAILSPEKIVHNPEALKQEGLLNQSYNAQAEQLTADIEAAGNTVQDTMQIDELIDSKDIRTITLQDLIGLSIFPTIADRTAAAALYTGIDSSRLDVAIPLLGGPFFPLRASNVQADVVWANRGDGVIAQKAAKLKEGANYMLVVMGDANMHQSNSTVAAAFMGTLEAWARDGRISPAQVEALGKMVREIGAKAVDDANVKLAAADKAVAAAKDKKALDKAKKERSQAQKAVTTNGYLENFPGFDDSSIMHAYMDGISFDARKRVLEIMASKQALEQNAPPMQKILDATREPSLAGHRWGDGVLLVEVDQTNPQVELGTEGTTHHPDFPVGVRGRVVGKLNAAINWELLWQDWLAQNADKASPRRAFELAKPIVTVTQDLVDRIGKVTQANIDGPRQARLAADFAAGNWRTSDDAVNKNGVSPQEFIDALMMSDAKDTLTQYTLADVKQGIKDGTKKIYQLGDGQIYFMLETRPDGTKYLASVVNNEKGARGIGAPAVVLKALEEGATDLDCFGVASNKYPQGFLPSLYAAFGFEVTERYGFDAQYFQPQLSEDQRRLALADAVHYWQTSTPGFDPQVGMPDAVTMKWKGDHADRKQLTERYLRGGLEGLLAGRARADAEAATAEFDAPDRAEAGSATPSDGGRVAGDQGAGAGASIASRARGTVQALAELTDNELANLGLTAQDRAAVRHALGQPPVSDALNQSAVPNKYQDKYLAGRDPGQLNAEERAQYDALATPAETLQQPARGTYDIASMTTVLNGTADLSTFLHETGHFFLDAIRRVVQTGAATPEVQAMYAGALKGLGVTEAQWEQWHAEYEATGKISDGMRAAHEKWAETFELYLFTGKAPNQEIQSLFRTFASWLKRVYKSIESFATGKGLALDADLKAVMDKMLATDEQIAEAEKIAGLLPDLDATAEAQEKLNARSMRDLQWARNALNKHIAKLQKEAKSLRAEVEAEVRAEVGEQPIYKALRFIKKGEITVDGEQIKTDKGHKLNTEAIAQMYPESMLARPDLTKLKGLTSPTGLTPDMLADALPGFTSGDQLVRALIDAEPMESVVQGMTDQRMLERHGDLATPEAVAQAAIAAVHNEARAKSLATELAAQREQLNARTDTGKTNAKGAKVTVNALTAAAKQFAQNVIGRRAIKDLKKAAWAHLQAERRAGKAWEAATAKGDTQAAVQAKQDQMLNNAAVRAAQDAQSQVRKATELFKKVLKGTDEKLVERGYDPDIANAARAVLAAYGIAPAKGKTALEYLELVQKNDPAMYGAIAPSVTGALMHAKPLADLTVDELGALTDEIESLWHLARRSRQMEIDGNLMDREDVQEELKERLVEIGIPDSMPGDTSAITPREQALRKLSAYRAMATRMENWAQHMGSAFTRYAFQPVKEAADRYRADKGRYLNKFRALLNGLEFKRQTIEAPELGYTFGKDSNGVAMAEILHAIVHTGNESNKRKLLLGRDDKVNGGKWASENPDGTLNTTKWDAFIARMVKEGVITQKHYDFAQGVWDLLEETKPLAQKTHRDVFGRYFAEVTADAFVDPFGITRRGGYAPAIADPRIVDDAATRALAEAENENMAYAFPSTNKGFTKGRVEYNRPLMLNIGTLTQHIDKVLKFSHLESPVRDVRKVLTAKGVAYGLNRIDPVAFDNIVTPWLNRAARQSVETPVSGDEGLSRIFTVVRNRAGLGAMFANVANAAQQITGFSMAAVKVKPSFMIEAAASMVKDRKAMLKAVGDASVYMKERMENDVANAEAALRDILLDPTAYEKAKDWSNRHAYFLQQAVDNAMGPVIWTAAYNQAVASGVGEQDAVRHADSVIRTTQGSTLPEDISRFESGPAWARVFTQFTSYFNMQANLIGGEIATVARDLGVKKGAGKMLYVTLLAGLAPAWVGEAIMQVFRGGPDDEDKDGEYLDDWLAAVFGWSTLRGATAMIPAVGPVLNAAANAFNTNPNDDRVGSAAAVSKIEAAAHAPASVYKAIVGDGNQQKAVRDVSALITLATGLPVDAVAKPLGYAAAVHQNKVRPTSAADAVRGAVTGVASPQSK